MTIEMRRWAEAETADLAEFLGAEAWPFHAGATPDREALFRRVADGYFDGEDARTFWVMEAGDRLGLARVFDLRDNAPMFDLRLRSGARGRGVGTLAVTWLTAYLFDEFPAVTRIEATTREDNRPMRRVLVKCGYQQEARYRRAWPIPGQAPMDALGYAVLRAELNERPLGSRPLLSLGALVVDCEKPGPVAEFWAAAAGGEVVGRDATSVSVTFDSTLIIWRAVADHRPTTWPSPSVPLHAHVDWWTDDLAAVEAKLLALGARPAELQAHRADGLVVMVDPAGYLFCIGTRI